MAKYLIHKKFNLQSIVVVLSFFCKKKKSLVKAYPIVEIRLQNIPENAYIDSFFKLLFRKLVFTITLNG